SHAPSRRGSETPRCRRSGATPTAGPQSPIRSRSPSTSLDRAEQLDPLTLSQLEPVPLAAWHDLGIHSHREPSPVVAVTVDLAHEACDRDPVRNLPGLAVQNDPHRSTSASRPALKRSGENGTSSCGGSPPTIMSTTASAVSGASRIPLRQCPVAQ